jgi:hypothetical protein
MMMMMMMMRKYRDLVSNEVAMPTPWDNPAKEWIRRHMERCDECHGRGWVLYDPPGPYGATGCRGCAGSGLTKRERPLPRLSVEAVE